MGHRMFCFGYSAYHMHMLCTLPTVKYPSDPSVVNEDLICFDENCLIDMIWQRIYRHCCLWSMGNCSI